MDLTTFIVCDCSSMSHVVNGAKKKLTYRKMEARVK